MKRTGLVLALTTVAIAIVAFYGVGSQRVSLAPEPAPERQPAPKGPPEAQVNESTPVAPPAEASHSATVTEGPSESGAKSPARAPLDEAEAQRQRTNLLREAVSQVGDEYLLMLDDLDLSPQEKEAMLVLLANVRMAAATVIHYDRDSTAPDGGATVLQRGTNMPEEERSDKIAAIIGDAKLQQFLAMERNRSSYYEAGKIVALLKRKDAPLTDAQRRGLLKMLVEVRDMYTLPTPDVDRDSVAYMEHALHQQDEYDRHAVELMPTVLSPQQGVYVFDAYQRMAFQRADSLEEQKKQSITNPNATSWHYPPRWSN